MKKLLTLGTKQWFSGISSSNQLPTGLFLKGIKLNPFVNPFIESADVGVLQTSSDPVDLTGALTGTNIIWAGVSRVTGANAGNLYLVSAPSHGNILGASSGNLYSTDLATDSALTLLRGGSTFADPANGVDIYQASDATDKYLYYFRQNKIGRWDFDGPTGTFIDDWDTGLTVTSHHPNHSFKGAVYFGNGNGVGKIYSVSGFGATTTTTTANGALNSIPADFRVLCLEDDGDNLIIGATKNRGDNTLQADTRIYFWDTLSQNWNKEWIFPDYSINSIVKFENGFLAFGGRGVYYFNFSTKPQKIKTLGTANTPSYGYQQAADIYNEAAIWGGGSSYISTYGKIVQEAPRAYLQPFGEFAATQSYIEANTKVARIYVGTNTPSFHYLATTSGGGTTTTVPETVYLPFGTEVKLEQIEVLLATPLASGDSLTLSAQADEATTAINFTTLAYDSTEPNPRRKRYHLYADGGIISTQVKLFFNFSGGNIKIKELNLYGTPIL